MNGSDILGRGEVKVWEEDGDIMAAELGFSEEKDSGPRVGLGRDMCGEEVTGPCEEVGSIDEVVDTGCEGVG